MATKTFANQIGGLATTTLNGAMLAGDLTFTVHSTSGFPSLTNGEFQGILDIGGNQEIVTVTALADSTYTCRRATENASTNPAVQHADGALFVHDWTAGSAANMVQLNPSAQQTGDINVSGTVTAGTALSGPLAASNLTGAVALARLPTETDSTDTSSSHLVTSNDARLSDTRTPKTHALSHDVGGSDVLKDLTRLAAGPAINGYTAWNFDVAQAQVNFTVAAGIVYQFKIMTAHAYTINTVDFYVAVAGTGVTALANCFIGIYDSGGTRRYVSADQSSNWATNGAKSLSLGGSAYTVTANDFVYIALLIGTQATTNLKIQGINAVVALENLGLTAAAFRWSTQLSGQTSLPSSLTLSSNAGALIFPWFAVK